MSRPVVSFQIRCTLETKPAVIFFVQIYSPPDTQKNTKFKKTMKVLALIFAKDFFHVIFISLEMMMKAPIQFYDYFIFVPVHKHIFR